MASALNEAVEGYTRVSHGDLLVLAQAPHATREDRGAIADLPVTYVTRPSTARGKMGLPGWWEENAQRLIRGLRPPLPTHHRLLVVHNGEPDEDPYVLGAVHQVLDAHDAEIRVPGVHRDAHQQGLETLLLRAALEDIERECGGAIVTAVAHVDNMASRLMPASAGLEHDETAEGWTGHSYVVGPATMHRRSDRV